MALILKQEFDLAIEKNTIGVEALRGHLLVHEGAEVLDPQVNRDVLVGEVGGARVLIPRDQLPLGDDQDFFAQVGKLQV